MAKGPDVLLIVTDCATREDVIQGARETSALPNLAKLMGRGTLFDRALSPSHWTLPSHASMFTGLFPWEHGAVSYSSRLAESIPTFAETALKEGYRTASFSGNPYVSDQTGLTRGFEVASWGRWGDCFYRGIPGVSPPRGRLPLILDRTSDDVLGRDEFPRVLQVLSLWLAESLPGIPDLLARILSRISERDRFCSPRVSPWIEKDLERWLRTVRREDPILAFVNLLDAHEPYLGLSNKVSPESGLLSSWEALRAGFKTPQRGFDLPSEEVRTVLHQLYRVAIRIVDERVGRILRSFEENRDIDNTLIVVVGDHGQAFGEGGIMYHGYGTEDVLFRVPLIIVPPGFQARGDVVRDWTSTTTLADLIRRVVSEPGSSDGTWPFSLGGTPMHDGPVWALGSSSPLEKDWIHASSGMAPFRSAKLVGYRDEYKVVLDPANAKGAIHPIGSDQGTPIVLTRPRPQSEILQLLGDLDNDGLSRLIASGKLDEVFSRLDSWGYA